MDENFLQSRIEFRQLDISYTFMCVATPWVLNPHTRAREVERDFQVLNCDASPEMFSFIKPCRRTERTS